MNTLKSISQRAKSDMKDTNPARTEKADLQYPVLLHYGLHLSGYNHIKIQYCYNQIYWNRE